MPSSGLLQAVVDYDELLMMMSYWYLKFGMENETGRYVPSLFISWLTS